MAAEQDTEFLPSCFVDTGAYDLAQTGHDNRIIIVGRTGTGLSYLHRIVEDDQDEPSINLDSLRKLALFLLSERRLGNPQLGVNPNGLILAEWPVGEKGVLAMEFLASGGIRFAAISGPAQSGVETKRISGTLSKSETLNAVRPFTDCIVLHPHEQRPASRRRPRLAVLQTNRCR